MLRPRSVIIGSLVLQGLWALLAWQWPGFASASYPLILVLLPGLLLMWFILSPAFLAGALVIAAINVAYHLGVVALVTWLRRAVPPAT